MPLEFTGTFETPEEREIRKRRETIKRIRILSAVCLVSIVLRVFIKDPPPPPTPDRTKETIRYVPGMLDKLPASAIEKMDPLILAQIRAAEEKAKQETRIASKPSSGTYHPATSIQPNTSEEEMFKQIEFVYKKKRILKERERMEDPKDINKSILILFRGGGFIKAEQAKPLLHGYQIIIDRGLSATIPKKMVSAVNANSTEWKAPIPKGFVQLKPAKGITITIAKETAKRITVTENEI